MPELADIHLMAMIAGQRISRAMNDPNFNGLLLIAFIARRVPLGDEQASYDLILEVAKPAGVTRADLVAAFSEAAGRDFEIFGRARVTYATWAGLMTNEQDPTQYTFELTFCKDGDTLIWGFPSREAAESTITAVLERAKEINIKVACSPVSRMPF